MFPSRLHRLNACVRARSLVSFALFACAAPSNGRWDFLCRWLASALPHSLLPPTLFFFKHTSCEFTCAACEVFFLFDCDEGIFCVLCDVCCSDTWYPSPLSPSSNHSSLLAVNRLPRSHHPRRNVWPQEVAKKRPRPATAPRVESAKVGASISPNLISMTI